MAQYSILTDQEIKIIARQYNIADISDYKVLSGGSENTNYLISTKTGKFVLTVCEQKSLIEANNFARLLEHLAQHDFPTSIVVRNMSHQLVTLYKTKPAMLKIFLEGSVIADLSPALLIFLGEQLGKLHKIEAPAYLPKVISFGEQCFSQVTQYAADSAFQIWLATIQQYIKKYMRANLPKALIHSDIFFNNIIVSEDGNHATIMDFEEASYYYRLFDMGMMIVGTCSQGTTINLDKVHCLLQGYKQQIQLLDSELNALQAFIVYAAAATAFWRHKHFNYVLPDPARYDHYLEMQAIASFVKALPADCFFLKK